MAEAPPTLSLSGKRFVLRDQRKGTIRGVFALPIASKSPIPSQPDSSTTEFLGVEWDHPAYGKHDGVYNGVRYFGPTRYPTSGSFFKLENCVVSPGSPDVSQSTTQSSTSRVDIFLGVDIDAALHERYVNVDDESMVKMTPTNVNQTIESLDVGSVGGRHVEFVQSEAVRVVSGAIPVGVVLSGFSISSLASLPSTTLDIQNIEELDLSDNLLSSWPEVELLLLGICDRSTNRLSYSLPKLVFLNLSGNLFASIPPTMGQSPNMVLQRLVLNDTKLLWSQVCRVVQFLPQLVELHVAKNDINMIEWPKETPNILQKLSVLDLSNNALSSFQQLYSTLTHLPVLERLIINANSLAKLSVSVSAGHPTIAALSLSDNSVSEWDDVNGLSQLFPQLKDIRLQRNPVVASMTMTEARLSIIGRLPGLHILNGSVISEKEKTEAEKLLARKKDTTELTSVQLMNRYERVSVTFMSTETGETADKILPGSVLISQLQQIAGNALSIGWKSSSQIVIQVQIKSKDQLPPIISERGTSTLAEQLDYLEHDPKQAVVLLVR